MSDNPLESLLDPLPSTTPKLSSKKHYELDRRRFFVLFQFSVLNCNQCLVWFSFSSCDQDIMSSFFGPLASQANINLLLNWGPIIGMLTFLLQYWLKWHRSVENTFDLPTVMKLSVGLSVTGSFLRLLPILLSTLYDDIS